MAYLAACRHHLIWLNTNEHERTATTTATLAAAAVALLIYDESVELTALVVLL
jgi:hypothetical protein